MRVISVLSHVLFLVFVLSQFGCEQQAVVDQPSPEVDTGPQISVYADYVPSRIDITPLTEVLSTGDAENGSTINVYVSLLDSFGSQIKSPGTFRFELYEHVQRSASPKGRRVVIWPDIDVTGPDENNRYWRDFLRAYQFDLDLEPGGDQDSVLQVTFLCVSGKRLSDEFVLKRAE